jgi:iron(III) transport system substrate-binding protein
MSALPQGSEYQKVVDAATKEGKVVIYSTTDTKAAGPLIEGFEKTYPGIKVEYNDMNSTELYNRFISEQASGGGSGDVVWSSSMDTALKLATDYAEYKSRSKASCQNGRSGAIKPTAPPMSRWSLSTTNALSRRRRTGFTRGAGETDCQPDDKFKSKVTTYDIEKSGWALCSPFRITKPIKLPENPG